MPAHCLANALHCDLQRGRAACNAATQGLRGDTYMRGAHALAIALAANSSWPRCGPEGPNKADTGLVVGGVAGGISATRSARGRATCGDRRRRRDRRHRRQRDRPLHGRAGPQAGAGGGVRRARSGRIRIARAAGSNPDNGRYGDVVPSRPYKRGTADCRDYTHTIYIDGRPQTMRGTACRNRDGTWRNVA